MYLLRALLNRFLLLVVKKRNEMEWRNINVLKREDRLQQQASKQKTMNEELLMERSLYRYEPFVY